MTSTPPRRVAVTHPRALAARRRGVAAGPLDRQAEIDLDDVLVQSLISAQLRLSVLIAVGAVAILVGIPLLILAVPALQDITVARVPVAWLALAIGVFPTIIAGGWLYVRAAERYERRFRALRGQR